jgi:hypothetical protein
MDDDEHEVRTAIHVRIELRIAYSGEARHFNPDDVLSLAREGVESHYEVEDAAVEWWEGDS